MFWSMQHEDYGFVIRKADMNGQNSYMFVSEGLRDISAITVDELAEKLYWLDAGRRKIECVTFEQAYSGRKVDTYR